MPTTRRRTRANGEGGVRYEKARGRWVGTVTVGFEDVVGADGQIRQRQIRKNVTGKTKAQALERLREVQGAVDAGQDPAPRDLTVGRFLAMWLDDVLPGTVSPATERLYRNLVRLYVTPHLGQKRLRTLQARHVSLMLRALEVEGRSGNTRRLARSVLRRALRWGEAEGMVARNVAAIADGVKIGATEGRTSRRCRPASCSPRSRATGWRRRTPSPWPSGSDGPSCSAWPGRTSLSTPLPHV